MRFYCSNLPHVRANPARQSWVPSLVEGGSSRRGSDSFVCGHNKAEPGVVGSGKTYTFAPVRATRTVRKLRFCWKSKFTHSRFKFGPISKVSLSQSLVCQKDVLEMTRRQGYNACAPVCAVRACVSGACVRVCVYACVRVCVHVCV